MYVVYILKSQKDNSYYYVSTNNLKRRLKEHNSGSSKYTKGHRPYLVHYKEVFENKSKVVKKELFFKTIDGYNWLKKNKII